MSVFGTHLNDSFHVTAFCTNKPSRNLELFVIWNLYVKPACVFDARIHSISSKVLVLVLIVVRLLLIHHERFRVTVFSILENVFVFKHRFLLLLFRLFVKTLIKVLFICKSLLLLGLTVKSRVFFFLFYQWLHF